MLTRLQRQLTASLFMHENKEVFVTFSAGVTALRDGEALEAALERADEALVRGQAHRQEPHLHRLEAVAQGHPEAARLGRVEMLVGHAFGRLAGQA